MVTGINTEADARITDAEYIDHIRYYRRMVTLLYNSDIWATARQPSITTVEGLLEAVFTVGSAPRLYSEDPSAVECSETK
jgi:hypothetical protein